MIAQRDIDQARNAMVDDLVRRGIIRTPAVERAFRRVPRHAFLPSPYLLAADPRAPDFEETTDPRRVYSDVVASLTPAQNLTSSTPAVVAEQIEQLIPEEGMRVLHVGVGSGYCTALLAELAGDRGSVVGVEYDHDLVELSTSFLGREAYTNVTIREGDGAAGVSELAPFERILVSAGIADIAPAWVEQLVDDGRLVLPLCQVGALGPRMSSGLILTVDKLVQGLWGWFSTAAFFTAIEGAYAPHPDECAAVAEGLQRWFALEDFLRTDLRIRVAMKADIARPPNPASVSWLLETRSALMWVEPN